MRMGRTITFAVFVLLLWGTADAKFIVEKNSLKVTSPDSLKDVYECAIGNFGVPQYGGTMVGLVMFPKANTKACKSFDEFDISFKSKAGGFPTFLLVDRGGRFLTSDSLSTLPQPPPLPSLVFVGFLPTVALRGTDDPCCHPS